MVHSSDDGHVIAQLDSIGIVCFTRNPKDQELELLVRSSNTVIDAGVAGGLLYVVARDDLVSGIDPRVRATLERMIKRNGGRTGSSAVVVLSGGFVAAMVRSALAGLVMVGASRKHIRVFSTAAEACAWLAPEHGYSERELFSAWQTATAHLPRARDGAAGPR